MDLLILNFFVLYQTFFKQKKLYYISGGITEGWNWVEVIMAGQSSLVLIISICVILSVWFTQSEGTTKNTLMYTGIFLLVVLIILTIVMFIPPKEIPDIKNYFSGKIILFP